jgi:hypothetical protein
MHRQKLRELICQADDLMKVEEAEAAWFLSKFVYILGTQLRKAIHKPQSAMAATVDSRCNDKHR